MNYRRVFSTGFLFYIISISTNVFGQSQNKFIIDQSPNKFLITGHLLGLREGQKVYLTECRFGNFIFGKTDTAFVKNGAFKIVGNATGGPLFYLLDFGPEAGGRTCPMLIENGDTISINCDSDITKINHTYIESFLKLEGSPSNLARNQLKSGLRMYMQAIAFLRGEIKKISDSVGFDPALVESAIKRKQRINEAFWYIFFAHFYDDVLYKPAIPSIVIQNKIYDWSDHASWIMDIYKSLDDSTKQSYWGKYLGDYAKISVGQPFPTFNLPTPEGKTLALDNVVKKCKLTIVNFWADNSFEREKYHNELKFLYKKYHDKGLNIIGFNSDKYAEQWKDALKKYELPWQQVSELKGREGIVENVYHEFSTDEANHYIIHNTTNVLIDSEGKIIAWDPTGIELTYYLWKVFGE